MIGALLALSAPSFAATPSRPARPPATEPTPLGPLETYKDWAVGCDNGRACQAVSLAPEGADLSRAILIVLRRGAEAEAPVAMELRTAGSADNPAGRVDLAVDGAIVARTGFERASAALSPRDAMAAARAMARGFSVEIRQGKTVIDRPSPAGLSAALRFIDAQQGRVGTVTALVATGAQPASAVRAPPPLPLVRRVAPGEGAAAPLAPGELSAAQAMARCDGALAAERDVETYPLDRDRTLILLPCDAGAYNLLSVPLIASGAAGGRALSVARFDHAPGFGTDAAAPPLLVNADWDAATGRLSSLAKARGLGDCGSSEDYVWDGERFRLVEARAMGECRGAWEWITLWRARVEG